MRCFFSCPLLLVVFGLLANLIHAQEPRITVTVSQNPFPAGEVVTLIITMQNVAGDEVPSLTLPEGLTQAGNATSGMSYSILNGVQTVTRELSVPITAAKPGKYKIVPTPYKVGDQVVPINELEVTVVDREEMPGDSADPKSPLLRLLMGKNEFYQGEIVPVTATVYMPRGTALQRIGLIEVEKEGLAIQRFPQNGEQSVTSLGGVSYATFNFRSSLSALRPGKLKVGPAKVELRYEVDVGMRRGQFGFFGGMMGESRQKVVGAPAISINVLPLPTEGKPKTFSGAVGTFNFSATSSVSEVTVGDPVPVDMHIGGTGNFDAIQPPVLATSRGWKVYPARRYTMDQQDPNTTDLINRRVGYSVVIVPEDAGAEPASFEFSYFDPDKKTYQTLRSHPLTLVIKPAANASVAAVESPGNAASGPAPVVKPPAPQADLSDIVSVLPASPTWATVHPPILKDMRFVVVNSVLALAFLALVGWAAWQKFSRAEIDARQKAWREAIHAASAPGLERGEFYRRAVRCLQLANRLTDSSRVMERYEALNFSSAKNNEPVSAEERTAVLAELRALEASKSARKMASPMTAVLLLGLLSSVNTSLLAALSPEEQYAAALAALEKQNFVGARQAAENIVKSGNLSRDVLQLAGNAAYREGNPGLAAIWYQRAMLFPTPGVELRQNLRHVSERTNVLMPPRSETLLNYGLSLSRNQWFLVLAIGGWLALFSLTFLIIGARPPLTLWASLTLVFGLGTVAAGAVGLVARPSYDEIKDLVFVMADNADLHSAASLTSSRVIAAPTGSVLLKVLERGTWSYLEAQSGEETLRGWLPTDQLTPFWPYDPAALP